MMAAGDMFQLTIQQAFDLALQHHRGGRFNEAEQVYRQILEQEPRNTDAMHFLGVLAHQVGRNDIAVKLLRDALALRPDFPAALSNLSIVLLSMGQTDDAVAVCRQAIDLNPNLAEAHYNLGNALQAKERFDEAIACYRQAILLRPNYPDAYGNLGNALHGRGQLAEAVAVFQQGIALRPANAEVHYNLGNAFKDNGQPDEAVAAYRRATVLKPDYAEAHNNLGNVLKNKGRIEEAIAAYRAPLCFNPHLASVDSNVVYSLLFHAGYDARAIAEEHRRWNRQHAEPLRQFIQPFANDRNPDRRLRVGYVSGDFRQHVIGRMLLPLFNHHDHQQFEIICYSQVLRPDAMTSRFQELADGWSSVVGVSDEQLDRQIRDDRIDILVDLMLHGAGNRLLVFARKPAPVQVTYLAYPGSTGMSVMDYRFSDPYLDPPDADLSCYSEKTIRLPRTYWCYQPGGADIETSPAPAHRNGFITFGCLNNFAKVSGPALDLWGRILMAVPNSRLLLHALPGTHRAGVAERLQRAGVDANRIQFVGNQSWESYAQTYSEIDIALDPFPYVGGITTCDALWMGVPVVTLSGETAVGRGGRSILSNIGLTDLIAFTQEQYMQMAIELAGDQRRMDELREGLRDRMRTSPLMNAEGFSRDVEAAYREMWHAWRHISP